MDNYLSKLVTKIVEFTGKTGDVVVGVACIVVGVFVCFFGRRLLRPTLAIGGFAVGIVTGRPLIATMHQLIDPKSELVSLDNDIIKVVLVAIGIIMGLLFMNAVDVAMYLIAAAGGMVLVALVKDIMKRAFAAHIPPHVKIIILGVAGLLPLLLVRCLENVVLSVCTAIVGSAIMLIGVDMFTQKGFFDSLKRFWSITESISLNDLSNTTQTGQQVAAHLQQQAKDVTGNKDVLFMFGGFMVIAAAGALYQLNLGKGKDDN